MKQSLSFVLLFLFLVLSSQKRYKKEVVDIINGEWLGTEQRISEWGKPVNAKKEPLELDIELSIDENRLIIKRYFYFPFKEERIKMTAQSYGNMGWWNHFAIRDESVISDRFKFSYPGYLSKMPHYLFEEGKLNFVLKGNKLILSGIQKIIERNEYTTDWRVFDSGVTRHFRKKDNKGNTVFLKGKKPVIVPGGFFYNELASPGYSSEGFNRYMAEYKWYAEKKLSKKELIVLQPYFQDSLIKKTEVEEAPKDLRIQSDIKTINVKNEDVEVLIFDNGEEDGDIISVYLNGELIASKVEVKKQGEKLDIKLKKGKNKFTVLAENEGMRPPNTAALTFFDRKNKQTIVLHSKKGKRKTLKVYLE